MNEHAQAADGRPAFDHRYEAVRFCIFVRPAQIQRIRLEYKTFFRDSQHVGFFFTLHVQRYVVISQELMVQRQVDAVRIDTAAVEGLDDDVPRRHLLPDAVPR